MTQRRGWRRVSALVGWLLLAGLAVAWFTLARPLALGGDTTYLKVSGTSMEPGLHTGDLVILRRANVYRVGDVVAYRVPPPHANSGAIVIHRIVEQTPDGFVTRGDNTFGFDPWSIDRFDILGVMAVSVPSAGHMLNAFDDPALLAALMFLAGFLAVMTRSDHPAPRRQEAHA